MEANGANAGTVLMLSSFGIALGRGIEFDPRFDPKPIKKMNQLSKKFRHPLTLGIFLFAGIAGASPISYSISFTLNPTSAGPLPSGGSFTYDSAAPATAAFSNFKIIWDGLTFDFNVPGNGINNASISSNAPLAGCLPLDS